MASFVEAVLKRKVATICDYVGYHAITRESSNVLVDIYRRTILSIARHSKESANNNRRIEPTLIDLIQAYEFVGVSIPELQEYAERVKIPFNIKLESHDDDRPSNRLQRNLLVDDLLDAEKNIDRKVDKDDENKDSNDVAADEDDKNMTPLLKDIYQEISTQFPSPAKPIRADKIRIKREEKPVIPKLKITPLDPSIAEPPSFLPILGDPPEPLPQASTSRPIRPPLGEKLKRGRQKGMKLKSRTQMKASAKAAAKAKDKAASKVRAKAAAKAKVEAAAKATAEAAAKAAEAAVKAAAKAEAKALAKAAKAKADAAAKASAKAAARAANTVQVPKTSAIPAPPEPSQRPTVICTSQDDICPECQLLDDGSLMIQCDDPLCARWFHGKCVGVLEEPENDDSWFCKHCVDKQQSAFGRRRRPI